MADGFYLNQAPKTTHLRFFSQYDVIVRQKTVSATDQRLHRQYIIASLAPPTDSRMACSDKYARDASTGLLEQKKTIDNVLL